MKTKFPEMFKNIIFLQCFNLSLKLLSGLKVSENKTEQNFLFNISSV